MIRSKLNLLLIVLIGLLKVLIIENKMIKLGSLEIKFFLVIFIYKES